MKKLSLLLVLLVSILLAAPHATFAADPFLDDGLPKMKQDLQLSDAQTQKIREYYQAYKKNVEPYTQKQTLSQDEIKLVQTQQSTLESGIRSVFTPQQKQKLEALRKVQLEAQQKQMHEVMLAQLDKKLSLTSKQRSKVDGYLKEFEAQVMPIVTASSSVTPDIIKQINELKDKRDKKIGSILTTKQKATFKKMLTQPAEQPAQQPAQQ